MKLDIAELYQMRNYPARAMRLNVDDEAGDDNAETLATFCGGRAEWFWESKDGSRGVRVALPTPDRGDIYAFPGDWVVHNASDDTFAIIDDEEFAGRYHQPILGVED